jgi:hypothetical protein
MIKKFRRIPYEIFQAIQYKGIENIFELKEFVCDQAIACNFYDETFQLKTVHGDVCHGTIGDWIIKNDEWGYFYLVKEKVFNMLYEEING